MPKRVSRYQRKETVSAVRRGELYLVAFDPTVGYEIQKTRPALIIQNDVGNQYSPLTIVAAVTSKVSPTPFPVEVVVERAESNGLKIRSAIRLDQIRTIDRQRLIQRLGSVDPTTMRRVDTAIQISLGLVDL
jgi:mRNA interferase MazF